MICHVYIQDFVCFDYPLPARCAAHVRATVGEAAAADAERAGLLPPRADVAGSMPTPWPPDPVDFLRLGRVVPSD